MVVGVGLLSLSVVTLRSSGHGAARSEAQANAKLALMLALADLQKAMGPDSRISARAETLAQHPSLGASVPPGSATAWWVGASHSDTGQSIGPSGQPVVWLISGLDPDASADAQISQPFEHPVPMYGEQTIDTAKLTGGQPIEAGSVMIQNQSGQNAGGYAYFIDDNGMKAQLAASNPGLRNDRATPHGGGVLPGTYDLSILEGMDSLDGTPMEEYNRLGSLNDLPLIGAETRITREKRLGYTILSRGVLSDVRKGGLKRDLTIAFENESVFARVFPDRDQKRYLVMDAEKLAQSADLQRNGYIHWEMFKDYYNLKKHIQRQGRNHTLDHIAFTKNGIFWGWKNEGKQLFGQGQLGPHDIGVDKLPSWLVNTEGRAPSWRQGHPYGDFKVLDDMAPNRKTEYYKHSPITPILSLMQQNAWVEMIQPTQAGQRPKLKTHVQLWSSHYNPYNIAMHMRGDTEFTGPRIIHFPQVEFTVGNILNRESGLGSKRQCHVNHPVVIGPGRSQVMAFKNDDRRGKENDGRLYDDSVKDLTLESVYEEHELQSALSGPIRLEIGFILDRPAMLHGTDEGRGPREVSQVMFSPFAWDSIGNFPGKKVVKTVDPTELNENSMISNALALRTTREGSGSIRPLIDANIRAIWCNPKWDSPLGLSLLAGYSSETDGIPDDQFIPMNTVDQPSGYTYWGSGRDPSDGYDRVILFDVPREDLLSLGQLQHAGAGRFSYEPTYIVGNSYANLRIPLDDWKGSIQDSFSTAARGLRQWAIPGSFNLYDASYLVNEELWDSYIFTTIPQVADNYRSSDDPKPSAAHFKDLLAGDALLPNPRFIPYEPPGSRFDMSTLRMASGSGGTTGAFYHNAGHLMVDGSFNVNSTSVDAWEAFLSGTHELPYQKLTENGMVGGFSSKGEVEGVRFPRVKSVLGGPMETKHLDENYWTGFRSLEPEEVRELAEAVVEEIKQRGPFLTLGEFVNRKLESGDLGQRGALQAALDHTVNKGLDGSFEDAANHGGVPDDSTQGAGFPGQLLQGDVLQALSPYMTVRSDTFTIRAYGESRNPKTGEVRARAWCEAIVQRYPDPVKDSASAKSALAELVEPSSEFGRSFRIATFRWLSPAEI